jgi:hypothetical protein
VPCVSFQGATIQNIRALMAIFATFPLSPSSSKTLLVTKRCLEKFLIKAVSVVIIQAKFLSGLIKKLL